MTTEAVLTALSNALVLVIMATMTLAVGLGILAGLVWMYLWVGRKLLVLLHKAYEEAVKPLSEPNGKRLRG